tara:strand:- start:1711 stop:2592 length:882 start_codon:yes stop_codon:yes gene_type:complete
MQMNQTAAAKQAALDRKQEMEIYEKKRLFDVENPTASSGRQTSAIQNLRRQTELIDNVRSAIGADEIKKAKGELNRFNDILSKDPEVLQRKSAAAAKGAKTGGGIAERINARVTKGISAATIMPTIVRSIELLNSVKTGGFDNLALKAKNIFGITGADEGELSQNLGKAVLSQLRATFGAAFTAKEGSELKEIEAGFGKSAAANKRMLNNLLKFTQEYYKQGRTAAQDLGDNSTYEAMGRLSSIVLGGTPVPVANQNQNPIVKLLPGQEQIQFDALPSGATFIDPEGNERTKP